MLCVDFVAFFKPLQRASQADPPELTLVGSAPGPGRFHAWPWSVPRLACFSSFGVEIPSEIRSAPALLSVRRLPFGADSTSEIRPQACLFACCLPSLRHRLPDRNPASSLLVCLLPAHPWASTSRAKSGLKRASPLPESACNNRQGSKAKGVTCHPSLGAACGRARTVCVCVCLSVFLGPETDRN